MPFRAAPSPVLSLTMFSCCVQSDAQVVSAIEQEAGIVVPETPVVLKQPEPAPAPVSEPEPVKKAPEPEPAPAPAPVAEVPKAPEPAPAAAPKGPSIEFKDKNGGVKSVEFKEGPLGITFQNNLVITGVAGDGVGDQAGVEAGWTFTKIGETSLGGMEYNAVLERLRAFVAPFPKRAPQSFPDGAVILEFLDSNGRVWQRGFTRKPLGMTFDGSMPIRVKAVVAGGPAEEVGVQPGWEFSKVAGANVKGTGYANVMSVIKGASANLP